MRGSVVQKGGRWYVKTTDSIGTTSALSWPATALGANFNGYRIYRRRRGAPVRPWVMLGDITVPAGCDSTTTYNRCRAQGRQVGLDIRSNGTEDRWRLGTIRMDISKFALR